VPGHMQICTSPQTDNHTSTPPHLNNVFIAFTKRN